MNKNKKLSKKYIIKKSMIPAIAFIYSLWAIYDSGLESVLYGILLAALGVPVYFYMKKRSR